ncbi:hypothetical protein [Streptomyces justiciae]|uniref:hypothetical protein n=1 Tax=Streptomyces justiciae TaxID=2780140 RepID=UPI00187FCE17|nr:hypothetical protein [Streptomyces justiciae]MBE8474236.1 hypothetical protein [Streptomyces justiciae]
MSTNPARPLPLPASATPDGCPSWGGEQTRRWTDALPPRRVPVPRRTETVMAVVVLGLGAALLAVAVTDGDVPPLLAAFLALQPVWLVARPEVVRFTAPTAVFMVVALEPSWLFLLACPVLAGLCAQTAEVRLAARKRQREAALAAAGGVTAPVPYAEQPVTRGKGLAWFGSAVTVAGVVLSATSGVWDDVVDREGAATCGLYLTGLGLTVLLSAALGRRRAVALRREPAPVLRVLVRENTDVDTEVFAADDVGALRPLFTVSTLEMDEAEDSGPDTEDEDDDELDEEELNALLDRLDDDAPGPLREAVLYGAPYDGAEVVVLAADADPDEPPVVEYSTGPVRPVSERAVRRAVRKDKREVVAHVLPEPGAVRRWRAGWPDWLSATAVVLWAGQWAWSETGVWRWVLGAALALCGGWLLTYCVGWRITADSAGLWFNGVRRTQHIAWDHIRVVRCKGNELKIDSRRATFAEWSAFTLRWRWLERKLGLVHPYERAAAEITAMWKDPEVRPTGGIDARERERRLWPVTLALVLAWTAALYFMP